MLVTFRMESCSLDFTPPMTIADNADADRRQAIHSKRVLCARGKVNDPPSNIRAAIVDADRYRASSLDVGDAHAGAERQRAMGGGELACVESLAARRAVCAFAVVAGKPVGPAAGDARRVG